MGKLPRSGRVEAVSDASPAAVWEVVADVTRVGEWSHECLSASWVGGATAARPGARFRGRNHVGRIGWSRTNEIVTVARPREIVWRTVPTAMYPDSTEWRIMLEPTGTGTRIVQTFEVLKLSAMMDRLIWRLTPSHRDRLPALQADLEQLAEVAGRVESSRPY